MSPKSPKSPKDDAAAAGDDAEERRSHESGDSQGAPLVAEDDGASDTDSALGISDDQLSSESLRSSIYHYQLENGRKYHCLSEGKYILPNDDDENDRLDIQNHHFLLTFDGQYCFCPGADDAKRVLDVGTGTGIWAIEFADDHPLTEVTGVDLSPIQPNMVPINCKFEIDDVEKEWTWSKPFDYIFSRMMVGSFADWDAYIKQASDHLTPGGWIEAVDCLFPIESDDGTLNEDQAIMKWINLLIEASTNLGRPLTEAKHHKERLIKAGFENVEQKVFKWPTNPWPRDKKHKEVGLWTLANIGGGLEGLSLALMTRGLGWTQEEVLAFLVQVRKDLRNPRIHAYWPIVVVYGQKPLE
ncbi:TAM domain methyltransferase [Dactylonectria estremocensis]|uniref:TAM domain methyltransferase n=1 Tax=Dactylonectria estremocensis TaxID=1079267 RepID=A0A9P9DGH9_9HYPO|nr:TAM domain methyltransferase [Dactylonectria estremocensis]